MLLACQRMARQSYVRSASVVLSHPSLDGSQRLSSNKNEVNENLFGFFSL